MKYKYTVLFGILWGAVMLLIWSLVFSNIIEASGFGIGIALGIAFSCCGCLFGYSIDQKNNKKQGSEYNKV